MRWLILLAMLVMPIYGARAEVAGEGVAPNDKLLMALVAEALDRSEELAALRSRIEAAEAMVRPAGALPDPMASIALSNVPVGGLELDRTPMTGVEVGLQQQVPASSKRRLKSAVQSEEAEALRAGYEDRRNDLVRRVKRAYYDVQYFGEALRIAEDNRDLAKDLLATAEARYGTGKGLQQDVFQAQVRLSRMIDAVVGARQGRAAATTRLNKLLYREPEAPVQVLPALTMGKVSLDGAVLEARALEENPRLWHLTKRVEQAETKVGLAKAELNPDFSLGFRYRIRQDVPGDPAFGKDFWSASVGMTLPWVYRGETVDEKVRSAEAALAAAEADLAALRNELAAQVGELLVDVARLDEQLALVETALLPQAEGALSSSWAAYRTGKVEFVSVLNNQMNLYSLYLQRSSLLAERERALGVVELVVGGGLECPAGGGRRPPGPPRARIRLADSCQAERIRRGETTGYSFPPAPPFTRVYRSCRRFAAGVLLAEG